MAERWLPIRGYEGLYEISDLGRVRGLLRSHLLKPDVRPSGHLRVTLSRDGSVERFWVHRLVLETFVGPRLPEMECCHNDGRPANNAVSNLRWDTKSANAQDRRRHGTDDRARRTHCPHGHEYVPSNTYWTKNGWRGCRSCILARQKVERDRIKQQKVAA
jgi:hypothetical protein